MSASAVPAGASSAARHSGGIADASSLARWASAAASTGRQRAA